MADWVKNTLIVRGDADSVANFRVAVADTNPVEESSAITFKRILPPPSDIEDGDSMTSERWKLKHWGPTREPIILGVSEAHHDTGHLNITYTFETAYFTAEPIVRYLIDRHPELKFELQFVGQQLWSGYLKGEDGAVTEFVQYDEPSSHGESIERTGRCQCIDSEPVLPGCGEYAIEQALKDGTLSPRASEIAGLLLVKWSEEFEFILRCAAECEKREFSDESIEKLVKLHSKWQGSWEDLLDLVEAL